MARYRVEYDCPSLLKLPAHKVLDMSDRQLAAYTKTMDVHASNEDEAIDLVGKMTDADPMYMYATLLEDQ